MQLPLQITFRNMDSSAAVEAKIREHASHLDKLYERIMSCRVVVELEHRHHHQGNLHHVRIDLKVPGAEMAVSKESAQHHAHEDVYVAIRDSFNEIGRQLADHVRRVRGDVKTHEVPPHGRIAELHEDHGKIERAGGGMVYFHRNSVVDADFGGLAVGDEVRFAEEMGELGPQASTVHVVGKHHVVG